MDKNISFKLRIWRQNGPKEKGHFDEFQMNDIPGDTSFLEMLDILNEQIVSAVCAHSISMAILMVLLQVLPLARSICVVSRMATPSPLSLGVQQVSLLSRI